MSSPRQTSDDIVGRLAFLVDEYDEDVFVRSEEDDVPHRVRGGTVVLVIARIESHEDVINDHNLFNRFRIVVNNNVGWVFRKYLSVM